jgi:PhoH-like ATPase
MASSTFFTSKIRNINDTEAGSPGYKGKIMSIFGLHEEAGIWNGITFIEEHDTEKIDTLCAGGMVSCRCLENTYAVLRCGSASCLAQVAGGKLVRITPAQAYGIEGRNVEQTLALCALLDDSIPLVTMTGRAGTGKTLLALAAALECSRDYHRIMLARPMATLEGQEMGFLPGDVDEKLKPYMLPLMDNLAIIKERNRGNIAAIKRIERMIDEEKIIAEPLAYIRGRSLSRAYLIVDEAQNLSPHEIKTIITRAGQGTKIVFTGDIEQIDNRKLDQDTNGLAVVVNRFKGQKLYAQINLTRCERSPLAELAATLL